MALQFKPLTFDDLPAVLEIERASYPFPWSQGIFEDCLRSGYLCWGSWEQDRLKAYAVATVAVGECHLLNICVAPSARRGGAARALLEWVFQQAWELGAEKVLLEVRVSNRGAISLYEGMGFVRSGCRKNYYPNGEQREDALLFDKKLERPEQTNNSDRSDRIAKTSN